eukprot:TRINITY_DN120848_c0_g1_i1.p1 TRINITY_DN120848_c0_g1~~TRINITY_DN120848_c0_g1_i1.p1  ORF type:complete len:2012 (+),score=453.76 TRINITY_DN120848_c0_g1_i1:106-6141(+)
MSGTEAPDAANPHLPVSAPSSAVAPSASGGSGRLRIKWRTEDVVEAKRKRIRAQLLFAAGKGAEELTIAAEEARRKELEFDECLTPAMEFMAVMGASHATVWKAVLEDLRRQFLDALRNCRKQDIDTLMKEMLTYTHNVEARDFVVAALERNQSLGTGTSSSSTAPALGSSGVASKGGLEKQAIDTLAKVAGADAAMMDRLSEPLQRQVWEVHPKLFLEKARPLIAEFVHSVRHRYGPLLAERWSRRLEPRSRPGEDVRPEEAALMGLAELIGSQPGLYTILRRELAETYRKSAGVGVPALRRPGVPQSGGAVEEAAAEPISIGAEPLLATIRSQLLMGMVERKQLQPCLTGTWRLTSKTSSGMVSYDIVLVQRGKKLQGVSQLRGSENVDGTLDATRLSFVQQGANVKYSCTCRVAQDMMSLQGGLWQEVRGGDGSGSSGSQLRGTFTGSRIGPICYADSDGRVWDEMTAMVVTLDRVQQRKLTNGLDSAACSELQHLAKAHGEAHTAALNCAKEAEAASGDSVQAETSRRCEALRRSCGLSVTDLADDVDILLQDPLLVHAALRGMVVPGSKEPARDPMQFVGRGDEANLNLEVRKTVQLVLCAAQGAVAERGTSSSKLLQQLAEDPPDDATFLAAGLDMPLLSKALRRLQQKTTDVDAENLELKEVVQKAGQCLPASSATVTMLRLLLNVLIGKFLLVRNRAAFEECLKLAETFFATTGVDWVIRQLVDVVVSNALQLGDLYDAGLRRAVSTCLAQLSYRDAWVHARALRLVGLYAIPHFAAAREEMTVIQRFLGDTVSSEVKEGASLCDKYFDWGRHLAEGYAAAVRGKSYLVKIYNNSKLGKAYPLGGPWERVEARYASPAFTPQPPPSLAPASDFASCTLPSPLSEAGSRHWSPVEQQARSLRLVKSEDAIMTPSIGERVREACKAASGGATDQESKVEAASEVAEALADGFRGFHIVANLAAKWTVALGGGSRGLPPALASSTVSPDCSGPSVNAPERILMRMLMKRQMVAGFDCERADELLVASECSGGRTARTPTMPAWLGPFIEVPEWRHAVYELVKRHEGQASAFLKCILHQISRYSKFKEELQAHSSTTSHFMVFCNTLPSELSRYFALLREDPLLAETNVGELCRTCSFAEYTYVYAQAVLHQLMRERPYCRDALRHISQKLTDVACEKSSSVLRLNLRFAALRQHPEIFDILHSMCRYGHDLQVVTSDVVLLCSLVENFLDLKRPSPPARSSGGSVPSDAETSGGGGAEPSRSFHFDNLDDCDGQTEVASDVGSWHDLADPELEDWEGCSDVLLSLAPEEPESECKSRRVYVSVASSCPDAGASSPRKPRRLKPQPSCTEQSEKTASIFHMPAVSTVGSAAWAAKKEAEKAEEEARESRFGQRGVLDALRTKAILEALISRFVDPSRKLSSRDRKAYVRLLCVLTTDSLWFPQEETDAAEAENKQLSLAVNVCDELNQMHQVLHDAKHSWLRRLATLAKLQHSAISSVVGLRWLQQVILSRRLPPREALARMAQGSMFLFMRRAVDRHPRQGPSVLSLLKHMLMLLPNTDEDDVAAFVREEDRTLGDFEDGVAGDTLTSSKNTSPGQMRSKVCRMIAVTLAFLVGLPRQTLGVVEVLDGPGAETLDISALHFCIGQLLSRSKPPYSLTYMWTLTSMLTRPNVLATSMREETRLQALSIFRIWKERTGPPSEHTAQRHEQVHKNIALLQQRLRSSHTASCSALDVSNLVGSSSTGSGGPPAVPLATSPAPARGSKRKTAVTSADPQLSDEPGELPNGPELYQEWFLSGKKRKNTSKSKPDGEESVPPPVSKKKPKERAKAKPKGSSKAGKARKRESTTTRHVESASSGEEDLRSSDDDEDESEPDALREAEATKGKRTEKAASVVSRPADKKRARLSTPARTPSAPPQSWSPTIEALQGRWKHSYRQIGCFTVEGNAATMDSGGVLGCIGLSPEGLPTLAGYVVCRKESKADEIVWRNSAGSSVSWTRPAGGSRPGNV